MQTKSTKTKSQINQSKQATIRTKPVINSQRQTTNQNKKKAITINQHQNKQQISIQ